jgi:hypothetical protein
MAQTYLLLLFGPGLKLGSINEQHWHHNYKTVLVPANNGNKLLRISKA